MFSDFYPHALNAIPQHKHCGYFFEGQEHRLKVQKQSCSSLYKS